MVTCYPVAGKAKSLKICQAFADGCGGTVASGSNLRDGPAMFYGVDESNLRVWRAVRAEGRDFMYADNSYFDGRREKLFRITRNALQHSGEGRSSGERFAATGERILPWRAEGKHILLCEQSEHFMRTIAGVDYNWLPRTWEKLRAISRRPITARLWDRNKGVQCMSLHEELAGAHALVTWSSAAAVTAILRGIPAIVMGPSAAAPMSGAIEDIEFPPMRVREQWAGVLADNEWSIDEMRSGRAWEDLERHWAEALSV